MVNNSPPATIASIEHELGGQLPGAAAQARMAPRPRRGWDPSAIPDDCRVAAALLLLYPRDGELHTLLTVRQSFLTAHAGQVSLPGGAVDDGESIADAAKREALEEVGVDPASVRVLGMLSPLHIPGSGYLLHPVVGARAVRPVLALSDAEVARVLEVPLHVLASPGTLKLETWVRRGASMLVPFFQIEDQKVWGATSMVLAELLALMGEPPDPWSSVEPGTARDTGPQAGDTLPTPQQHPPERDA